MFSVPLQRPKVSSQRSSYLKCDAGKFPSANPQGHVGATKGRTSNRIHGQVIRVSEPVQVYNNPKRRFHPHLRVAHRHRRACCCLCLSVVCRRFTPRHSSPIYTVYPQLTRRSSSNRL